MTRRFTGAPARIVQPHAAHEIPAPRPPTPRSALLRDYSNRQLRRDTHGTHDPGRSAFAGKRLAGAIHPPQEKPMAVSRLSARTVTRSRSTAARRLAATAR